MIFLSGAANAATINVNTTDSIQSKIDSANSGDTLNLSAGTHNACNLTVNKSLTITGPQTGSPAVINGQNSGKIFYIYHERTVTLKYLTLINGNANKDNANLEGGAIFIDQSNLIVIGCNITNNTANWWGGGICNYFGNLAITNSSISNNILIDNNGGYTCGGGGIYNNGTCTVTNSNITGNIANSNGGGILNEGKCTITNSNINFNTAGSGGGIYNNGNCTVIDSSIYNNTVTTSGGGIYNEGNCTVTGSKINENTASYGGGIYNLPGTLIVTGSAINNNNGGFFGGGILSEGNCTVTNSYINENTANIGGGIHNPSGTLNVNYCTINQNSAMDWGGGIHNGGNCTVNGCNFKFNNAAANGNAIYNSANTPTCILSFNRFYDVSTGYEIYSDGGNVDARYNWWGSNLNPSSKVYGNVTVNPWLVLTLNANPSSIYTGGISTITADLTHDSTGGYHHPASGHVPDGMPIIFTASLGSIITSASTVNGIAQTTLTGGSASGVADVSAALDSQTVNKSVIIDTFAPTSSVNINGGLYNANKVVYLRMNEPGTIYYTTNGATPTASSAKYTGPITITSTTTLRWVAVDLAGNKSPVYTQKYTIDKTAPRIISTSPRNYAIGVSRTGTIAIRFSENIKASVYWSKIKIVNKYGRAVSIRKWISGNTIYIKTIYKRSSYSYYRVYIPYAAVKDYAGLNLRTTYTFKFKTGRY